jgi:filamentous hemagglutinin
MNKNLHRLVFCKARNARVAVQETATGSVKGSGATSAAVGTALAALLAAPLAQAQIVANPMAPGNLRPTVLAAPNGTPIVNVTSPSAAGVSRNLVNQFDVNRNGVVFNNSRNSVQTQLGGWINGNPYLATGPARIILTEVNSANPTQLRGYVEVGGSRAEVIIANPSGISVDGGGTINASRLTLTTGTPQLNALGGLDSFLVRSGTVTIEGAGLDASRTDFAAILARAVEVNAGIWATDLKVVTGANQVSTDHGQVMPTTAAGTAPGFALDVSQLGGMYANHIFLVGTEAGLGARNAGSIVASASGAPATLAGVGQLVVTAAGRLENTGSIQASADATLTAPTFANGGTIASGAQLKIATQGELTNSLDGRGGTLQAQRIDLASAGGNIDNRNGGTIRQASSAGITLSAPSLSNTNGGAIGREPLPTPSAGGDTDTGTDGAGSRDGGTGGSTASGGTTDPASIASGGTTATAAPYVPPSPGSIVASGTILNDGGHIYTGGPVTLQTGSLLNSAGNLDVASMALNQSSFENHNGTLNVKGAFSAKLDRFDNSQGTLRAGSLSIASTGDLLNTDGTLTSDSDAALTAGGQLTNTRGTISAAGALSANVGGAVENSAGKLLANQGLTLSALNLDDNHGVIQASSGPVQLTMGQQLRNTQGRIASGGQLAIKTGSMSGAGTLQAGTDLQVAAAQGLAATGTNIAAGNITLRGASVDLSGSQTGAANIALTATQGNVTTSGATVATPGTLTIAADSDSRQALVNHAGQLSAGALRLQAANITNTAGGQILQTGNGALNIDTGTLANGGGILATHGSLTVNAGSVGNAAGVIRADNNITITSGGTVDDRNNGLISAGNSLAIVDPNAASPAAKTLGVVNTGGTLVATNSLQIDAAKFTADGQWTSGKDLSVALTQDIINNATIQASGKLSYTTTGNFTNNGQLLAGQTLTVGGNIVENAANAQLSGLDTTVNAGTLDNRGLIDSAGSTRIYAALVNNLGTGRIYGDQVAIGAGTLNNDIETVDGVANSGTIAARSTLDIGAGAINNSNHALLFSASDMYIGGALDANGYATGSGSTLDNLSARIESLGNLSVSMGQIDNRDIHIQPGPQQITTTGPITTLLLVGGNTFYPLDQVVYALGSPFVFARNPDGTRGALLTTAGYGLWTSTYTTTTDTAINADPAHMASGGDTTLKGLVVNRDSRITAGGTLLADNVDNRGLQGTTTTSKFSSVLSYANVQQPNVYQPGAPTSFELTGYAPQGGLDTTTGRGPGSATLGSANAGGGGTIAEVPSAVGGNGGQASAISMVVRTSTPDPDIPQASLFKPLPGPDGRYLIETDPRFANYRNWLGSDYLLDRLGYDPDTVLKRLGDGFYEQRLIDEQVARLTGYRYLDGYTSDEEQYAALMNAGVTFARQYGLIPGVALTPAQMAQLTSDIVWLVEQTVTLPDGSAQQVLVPQVYARVQPGDIDGHGALMSADALVIKNNPGEGDLRNTGTLAGRTVVSITADNVNNLAGRISGGAVGITARQDINDVGGVIDARNAMNLDAGRDLNVRTTTGTGLMGVTGVDRVAGLYVSNPKGGTLVASAGRDVNLIGAIVANKGQGGYSVITAGNDINLGTVQSRSVALAIGKNLSAASAGHVETGTVISTQGTTVLDAGRDVNARQATVDAGDGLLSVQAGRDIDIQEGRVQTALSFQGQSTDKGFLKSTTTTLSGQAQTDTPVGSVFSGGLVALAAGNDIDIQGSRINGTQGVLISAGNTLEVTAARSTASASLDVERSTKGITLTGSGFVPLAGLVNKASGNTVGMTTDQAVASTTTSSQGGALLQGGKRVHLQGAQVDAAKDIAIAGGQVVIEAATSKSSATAGTSSKDLHFGIETDWHDPSTGLNARKQEQTEVQDSSLARTTLHGANVSISATDTLAMSGTTIDTPGQLSLSADTLVLGTQATEHDVQTTGQGRDLMYQKAQDKGTQDQTTNYNRFNAGTLVVNANHIQAGLGARDSIDQLAQQPGMGWVNQLQNDPALSGKVDWQKVEEVHKNWDYGRQGLTPEGAAIVTAVVAYFTAGAASSLGEAAAVGAGQGTTATIAVGTTATTTTTITSGLGYAISGAVTAGVTTLASEAAVAVIDNQGDLAGALHDLGSSANVKNLLSAIVTGGVLGGMNLDPPWIAYGWRWRKRVLGSAWNEPASQRCEGGDQYRHQWRQLREEPGRCAEGRHSRYRGRAGR